jgi:hypothetical protein
MNLLKLFEELGPEVCVEKIELQNSSFRYGLPRYDQTLTPIAECGIEFVLRKASPEEIARGGPIWNGEQPNEEQRIHFNQYRDDYASMKNGNSSRPPFTNTDPL